MLANVTSRAQPMPPPAAVASASALTTRPISSTASTLMPARVVATFTDEQTRVVVGERLGDRIEQRPIAGRHPLLDQRREAADVVDPQLGRRAVERQRRRRHAWRARRLGDQRQRRDREARGGDRHGEVGLDGRGRRRPAGPPTRVSLS